MAKYVCTERCFFSGTLKSYEEGVVYDIDASTKKAFEKVGFMEHFAEDTTPKVEAVTPATDKKA